MSDKTPVLELQSVDKSFGPIDVLHRISLKVHEGEVLCLLGDNGAGKSTLIKTLAGVHRPTRGKILMDGNDVHFESPKDAAARGIATVHQFGGTFPLMSIGDHFAVRIRGDVAADFRKGERTREEITDLMAGGETMAGLESSIEGYMESHAGQPPPVA